MIALGRAVVALPLYTLFLLAPPGVAGLAAGKPTDGATLLGETDFDKAVAVGVRRLAERVELRGRPRVRQVA